MSQPNHSEFNRRPNESDAMRPLAAGDNELQADPEMQEGSATKSRVAIYAAAIAIVLGAVFYGMSSQTPSPTGTAQTTPPASTADSRSTSPPEARDVSPNREPGTTTGSAPAAQQGSPKSNPTGTEVDQNKGSVTR